MSAEPSSSAAPIEPTRQPVRELPYRVPWRSGSIRAGAHRSTLSGSGGLFRDFASLLEHPDPRRIDLRATARDPFEVLHVRRFEQKSAITVYVLVDVSLSMSFHGRARKLELAADLVAAFAASARRIGDSFGLIGCDSDVRPELLFPATRSRKGESEMIARLGSFRPSRPGAKGLAAAAALTAGPRKLVVIISDFHLPEETIVAIFQAHAVHDILPIVLSDSSEARRLPRWGLLPLTDLETGRRRLVAMRPALRAAWLERAAEKRAAFHVIANRYGRKPFEVVDRIDWEGLQRHVMGGGG